MRLEVVRLADHEEAVDHRGVRFRLHEGEDDEHLVHVRGKHAFAVASARLAAREHRSPFLDRLDAPLDPLLIGREGHVIADGELPPVALLLLEAPRE